MSYAVRHWGHRRGTPLRWMLTCSLDDGPARAAHTPICAGSCDAPTLPSPSTGTAPPTRRQLTGGDDKDRINSQQQITRCCGGQGVERAHAKQSRTTPRPRAITCVPAISSRSMQTWHVRVHADPARPVRQRCHQERLEELKLHRKTPPSDGDPRQGAAGRRRRRKVAV